MTLEPRTRSPKLGWSLICSLVAFAGVAVAFVVTYAARVLANLRVVHWEDRAFSTYVSTQIHSLGDCFSKPNLWPGLYRPLTTNLYYFALKAFGAGIAVPHVLNVALILANALLLYAVCLAWMEPLFAAMAAVLVVSRLALVEVVLHTCEMQALGYVFFGLLACNAWLRARRSGSARAAIASGVLLFLAMFAKEAALSFAVALVAWFRLDAPAPSTRPLRAASLLAPPIAFTLVALAILAFFGWPLSGQATGFRYDFSLGNVLSNLAATWLSFFNPLVNLRASMSMPPLVLRLAALWPVRGLVLALVVAEAVVFVRPALVTRRTTRLLALGFALFLAGALPFLAFEGRLYMRYAYLAHAGLAICGAALVRGLVKKWPRSHP